MDASQIPLNQTEAIKCDRCENTTFTESVIIRKISRLITGDLHDGVIPIPVFSCLVCRHVNQEFIPNELL